MVIASSIQNCPPTYRVRMNADSAISAIRPPPIHSQPGTRRTQSGVRGHRGRPLERRPVRVRCDAGGRRGGDRGHQVTPRQWVNSRNGPLVPDVAVMDGRPLRTGTAAAPGCADARVCRITFGRGGRRLVPAGRWRLDVHGVHVQRPRDHRHLEALGHHAAAAQQLLGAAVSGHDVACTPSQAVPGRRGSGVWRGMLIRLRPSQLGTNRKTSPTTPTAATRPMSTAERPAAARGRAAQAAQQQAADLRRRPSPTRRRRRSPAAPSRSPGSGCCPRSRPGSSPR